MIRARLSFTLVLSLLCAQLFLSWHAPSHIDPASSPHELALQAADCDLCGHGGFVALPSNGVPAMPASAPVIGQAHAQPFLPPCFALSAQALAPPHYA